MLARTKQVLRVVLWNLLVFYFFFSESMNPEFKKCYKVGTLFILGVSAVWLAYAWAKARYRRLH